MPAAALKQIALVGTGAVLVVLGQGGNTVSMNSWEQNFPTPSSGGPYTVLTASVTFILVLFAVLFAAWWALKRPSLRFIVDPRGFAVILVASFSNAVTSILMIWAAEYTPEFLQAALVATVVPYTLACARVVGVEPPVQQPWVLGGIVCLALAGVVLNGATSFTDGTDGGMTPRRWAWTAAFASAQLFQAIYGVLLGAYLRRVVEPPTPAEVDEASPEHPAGRITSDIAAGFPTAVDECTDSSMGEPEALPKGEERDPSESLREPLVGGERQDAWTTQEADFEPGQLAQFVDANDAVVPERQLLCGLLGDAPVRTDAVTAKLYLLTVTTFWLLVFVWAAFPLDFTPNFGTAADAAESWHNLRSGWHCAFGVPPPDGGAVPPGCGWRWNGASFFFFVVSTAAMNAGVAIMNRYSPPLASLVQQLASPLTIIAMIAFPRLNATQEKYNVGMTLGACALLGAAAVAYFVWDVRRRRRVAA